jgi:hypothetical protein
MLKLSSLYRAMSLKAKMVGRSSVVMEGMVMRQRMRKREFRLLLKLESMLYQSKPSASVSDTGDAADGSARSARVGRGRGRFMAKRGGHVSDGQPKGNNRLVNECQFSSLIRSVLHGESTNNDIYR